MMLRRFAALGLAACGQAALAQAPSLELRAQVESHAANPDNLVGVADGARNLQTLDLRWSGAAPFAGTVLAAASARRASDAGTLARVNELAFERAAGSGFISVGKKVMSWDVGYAFRPLDVVQQEDRRALNAGAPEGGPLLAWEAYSATEALTVVLVNPGRSRSQDPRGDRALALRWYRRGDARDDFAVLRLSARNGVEGGLATAAVLGDALELHASFLLQSRHEQWIDSGPVDVPATVNPMHWQRFNGGGKALVGMTWTSADKLSVLAEAWFDRSAYSSAQWRAWAARNVAMQAAPAALRAANLGWNAGSLRSASLRQRNVLLRAAQAMDELELSADLLWQPEDGGRIASAALTWKPGPWLLALSWRQYGGHAHSIARALPLRAVALATLQRAF